MRIAIADTFTKSLGKLPAQEQALVKQGAFDFQVNPTSHGMRVHRLDKIKEKHFWSFRVSDDLRVIFHQMGDSQLLCYAHHHDAAYKWAENRRVQSHPKTGAIQIVEVEERIEEVVKTIVREVEKETPIFDRYDADYLLDLGVPAEWLDAVQTVGEKGFEKLLDHEDFPDEASENLLELMAGNPVPRPVKVKPEAGYDHPDTKRRIRVVESASELEKALSYPLEQWMVFLHPLQRVAVEKTFEGPALVTGGAGTGKTVVALHRVAHLAEEDEEARILLTTFSRTLYSRLETSADILLGSESPVRGRIHIVHLHKLALELWQKRQRRRFLPVDDKKFMTLLGEASEAAGNRDFTLPFLKAEWDAVVDAQSIRDWEGYRKASRSGRGTPLGARQRKAIWAVFEGLHQALGREGLMTWSQLCDETTALLAAEPNPLYTHVVADEAQDFGPAEVRLLRTLVGEHENDLFLAADEGQRIYKGRFSWSSAGINVRGRSTRLRVNYRTTEQIRRFADSLLPAVIGEQDGTNEQHATVSLLSGPTPEVKSVTTVDDEIDAVVAWLEPLLKTKYSPRDVAIFARTEAVLRKRAEPVVRRCGVAAHNLKSDDLPPAHSISLGTMHRAKGLEFKAVVLMGSEDGLLPLRIILRDLVDEADREAFVERERHLFYVAATRARERLLVTSSKRQTAFLAEEM